MSLADNLILNICPLLSARLYWKQLLAQKPITLVLMMI